MPDRSRQKAADAKWPLGARLVAALPAGIAPRPPDAALEAALQQALRGAREGRAGVRLPVETFVEFLASKLAGSGGDGPAMALGEAVRQQNSRDLFLVCACLQSDPVALAELERDVLPEVSRALAKVGESKVVVDEVTQLLRQDFIFPQPGTPSRLLKYAGTGPLRKWVRAVAVHAAANLRRKDARPTADEEELLNLPALTTDPELAFIKERYREDFRAAFTQALAALSARDRTVLRLHFVQGLNIDAVGQVYDVHRATVARWISASRAALVEDTQRRLAERFRIDRAELNSLMNLVRSQVSVSMGQLLRSVAGPG